MGYNVAYKILPVLFGYDITVQVAGLYKVIIGIVVRRRAASPETSKGGSRKAGFGAGPSKLLGQ